jgi:beta-galactosidase
MKDSTRHYAVLFGASYYHEYAPVRRLDEDLELMAAAGFTVIRVGESVWSTWEPDDGVFDVEWLAPIVDGAHSKGISVLIGTPSYAAPPWLRKNYPETTAHRRTGEPVPYGGRQNLDLSSPMYRRLVERVVRRIVERYRDHPAVIGWQVDNEPGQYLLHNPDAFAGFVAHLQSLYGSVQNLNDSWNLTYWSQRIARWDELWTPDGNTNPAYALAWRRYQAGLTADFITWQAGIVKELARPDQFVTTCLDLDVPASDPVRTEENLDVTAANLYVPTQEGLAFPSVDDPLNELRPMWMPFHGVHLLALRADRARGVRQEPFLLTETNAQSIGGPAVDYPAFDGQWRQIAWSMIARGARMVEYWHWHTIHGGQETYWHGILGHSFEPGRCYFELMRLGAELRKAEDFIRELEPESAIGMVYSTESQWAMQFQPPLTIPGTSTPDPDAYLRIFAAFYRGFFDGGLSADIVEPRQLGNDAQQLRRRWPVLVAPAVYVASDAELEVLRAYAEAGGHLVLTLRTGYADGNGRMRSEIMPGRLREAAGVRYLEYTNLLRPVIVSGLGGKASGWADAVELEGANPLASYQHPHLERWPAVTTHEYGRGRVTYVGTIPDPVLGRALAEWVSTTSLEADPWRQAGSSLTCMAARTAAGELRFLANWSWQPTSVAAPTCARDILGDEEFHAGAPIALGPWDIRVLALGPR